MMFKAMDMNRIDQEVRKTPQSQVLKNSSIHHLVDEKMQIKIIMKKR